MVFTAEWTSHQYFTYSNCFELDKNGGRNILADARLRIQVMATKARKTSMEDYLEWDFPGASVSICFPGSEIPEWFINRNVESCVTIELPPDWCSSKLLGFALCVVVSFEDYYDDRNFNVKCKCIFDGDYNDLDFYLNGFEVQHKPRFLGSDHVFLLYDHQLYARVVQTDDKDHMFSIYQSCNKVSFEFSPVDGDEWLLLNCKVKKCGVSLLYSEEECAESDVSSIQAECVESGSDCNSNEKEEDSNTKRLKEMEPNSEANTLWFAQGRVNICLVGLALFFFCWFFLGIATVNG